MLKIELGEDPVIFLKRCNPRDAAMIAKRIKEWSSHQEPTWVKQLKENPKYSRIRAGDFRIIFYVQEEIMKVAKIGNRAEVYEKLAQLE